MAKTREGMIKRLESVLHSVETRQAHWERRAKERGFDAFEMQLPNGSYPMETLLIAESQLLHALTMLRGEIEEPEKPLLFDQMQHIYWSANGTSFCLSPPGDHGFLGVRGFEAGRPDCPECREKLEQFRSQR